jgi:haloalkane dehalogenase
MENVRRKLLRGSRVSVSKLSVLGSEIAYREAGGREKPVALFLHGNPTSSYTWRNILPLVAEVAYCVTPDLIGFGQFRPGGRGLYRGG